MRRSSATPTCSTSTTARKECSWRVEGPKGPTPVDAITHRDKRTNIPTADAQDFVDPEIEEIRQGPLRPRREP